MIVVADRTNDRLHWYDAEMVEIRRHTPGYWISGLTVQNDMLVVADATNNLIRWYDAEMNQLRQHALGYWISELTTQN